MTAACGGCLHFEPDPHALDRALPGTRALSSVHAASRSADGYCRLHDRLLRASAHCGQFEPLAITIGNR